MPFDGFAASVRGASHEENGTPCQDSARVYVSDKLAVAAVSTGVMYALLLYVFCLEAVVEEFAQTAPWLLWLTAVLGLLVFVVYDILLRRFTVMWRRKKRKA